jgi:alpha-N-arabinofuranosidase
MLFGQFLEHFHRQVYGGVFEPGSPLADGRGFRKDVIAALRDLQVPIVRWPGGCFVSSYHWKEGVGKDRQPSFDKAWGVEEPNTFGTDEYVLWCRAIGAEPYICTNAGTGTAEEMSDWVEYCNLKDQGRYARLRQANGFAEPHRVKYWSVGNENYGAWEIGAKTVAEWGVLVRESAKMMRAVDPNIQLLAAATADRDWTLPLLKTAGALLNYVSIHGYFDPLWARNEPANYLTCMVRSTQPEQAILNTVKIIEEAGLKDRVKIAYDEWNLRGWHHPPGSPGPGPVQELIQQRDKNDLNETYTMADALFSACFLNACLRQAQHVHMACMAPVVNARGPLFVHPKGIVRRTTFHTLRLYASLLQPNVLAAKVTCEALQNGDASAPVVDAVATVSDDKKSMTLALVNRHPERPADLKLDLGTAPAKARATVLAGDSPDAYNDVAHPDRVRPEVREGVVRSGSITLAPHSVTFVEMTV